MSKFFTAFLLSFIFTLHIAMPTRAKEDSLVQKISNLKLGVLLQAQGVFTQDRQQATSNQAQNWATQMQIWRANFLLAGNISKKTSFFAQTTIKEPVGFVNGTGQKNIQAPTFIFLDAQIEHQLTKNLHTIVGMQLVNINRQGLQTISSLLGLEFGWYQYPHLFSHQPLKNNFSRDIGASIRGYTLNDRLEYRLGVFRGGAANPYQNIRTIARLNYNFWDIEKDHYYTGQTLGKQKILAWGAGIDWQGTYTNWGTDIFLDLPIAEHGALTWSNNVMLMSGGNSQNTTSFTPLIPNQTIFFSEIGYFFKKSKLQPYLKYEGQLYSSTQTQYDLSAEVANNPALLVGRNNFNTLKSEYRWGIGLGYYPQNFNYNLKLQYENIYYGRMNGNNAETLSAGEIKLQFNYFMF